MKNQSFWKKLRNARNGIAAAWSTERNLRIQAGIAAAVILLFGLIGTLAIWWAVIVLCIAIVLGAELANSAIEALVDHLHPDIHPNIGRVKDILAGMVLVVSIGAAAVGCIALYATLHH